MISFETLKTLRNGYESSRTKEEVSVFYELEKNLRELLTEMRDDAKDNLLGNRIALHLKNLEFIKSVRHKCLDRICKEMVIKTNFRSGVENEKGTRKIK